MEAYALAVELKPQEPIFHANLAGALVKLNRIDEARRHAQEAISKGMTEHWVFKTLGPALSRWPLATQKNEASTSRF